MLNQPSLDRLRTLKLTGMAEALTEQLQNPLPDLGFEERLGLLIDREWHLRENRKLSRRLSQAKLKHTACVEDIDYKHARGLNKSAIQDLAGGQWIRQHFNLLITGPTGCGKTYIACALAQRACLNGFTARYCRLPRLWHELKVARANGSYAAWLTQTAKIDVLILDDWGITPPDGEQKRDLLEILEDRYQHKSTVITSQLPTTHWHEHLNDATLADAILDRLMHNAVRLDMSGESMRKKQKPLQTEEA